MFCVAASAFREPFGVLRFPSSNIRQSIIGRDDFFVRYGEKERDAISSFDFLDDMSTASISGASSTLGSLQKLDTPAEQELPLQGLADDDGRGTPIPQEADEPRAEAAEDSGEERTGKQISLSDSCGHSLSGSRSSLDEPPL